MGAIGHAIFVQGVAKTPWVPIFDTTTLWWTVLIAVGAALPLISEITVGGINVKLSQAQQVALTATHLAQTWMFTTRDLLALTEDPRTRTREQVAEQMIKFLKLRAYEAVEWIGQDGEDRRLSIWTSDAQTRELNFFFSNEIRDAETTNFKFEVGQGVIGTVFETQETWNEKDGPSLPVWILVPSAARYRYHGIFCTPINYGSSNIGVLCVDRQKEERFGEDHVDVLLAFASMVGIALGNDRIRESLATQ